MRVLVGIAISMAAISLGLAGSLWGQFKDPNSKDDQPPDHAAKETRLSLEDIRKLRGKQMSADAVVERVAEQGREFDVTVEVESGLRKLV